MADKRDNVVIFPGETRLPIPADRVLEAAMGKLERVVMIGVNHDGDYYVASSIPGIGDVIVMLEHYKQILLDDAMEG